MIVKVPAHVQEGRLLSLESVQKQKVYGSVVVICVLHYRLKKRRIKLLTSWLSRWTTLIKNIINVKDEWAPRVVSTVMCRVTSFCLNIHETANAQPVPQTAPIHNHNTSRVFHQISFFRFEISAILRNIFTSLVLPGSIPKDCISLSIWK